MPLTTDTATQSTQAAHYISAPWALPKLDDTSKDEQLKRYTMIFQALAALFTIILAVYAFTKKE